MALPKRRISKARGRKKRTHWKGKLPTINECPQCGQMKIPHRACPNCGYYKGKPVTTPSNA